MADDRWMAGAVRHPGALRATLGVKEGQRIPAAKLAGALHSKSPVTRKRAVLARTFRRVNARR